LTNKKLAIARIGDTGTGWFVYIIHASDGRLYTGITLDIKRRWNEHMSSGYKNQTNKKGAKFFRGRKPETLVFIIESLSRSTATKEEIAIKSISRKDKLALIASSTNQLKYFPELEQSCLPIQ